MAVTAFELLPGRAVHAADLAEAPPPVRLALAADDMPAPTETKAPAATEAAAAAPVESITDQGAPRPADLSYGAAARLRWVSVPRWLLNIFTKQNVPLSSYAVAGEFFRRKGEFEFAVSLGYQNMSPADGNWLGKTNNAATDTDYVQIRGLGFVGLDASFIWHTWVNDWFGLHYGAGLGIAWIFGSIYRTSDGSNCTDANAGNVNLCHPVGVNPASSVTIDRQIQALGPGPDDPANPHRFKDDNRPNFLPIVNILLGVDFRLPQVRGWEARLEGGFYDAFFLGGAVGYTF
jgi:hypothetical protein